NVPRPAELTSRPAAERMPKPSAPFPRRVLEDSRISLVHFPLRLARDAFAKLVERAAGGVVLCVVVCKGHVPVLVHGHLQCVRAWRVDGRRARKSFIREVMILGSDCDVLGFDSTSADEMQASSPRATTAQCNN